MKNETIDIEGLRGEERLSELLELVTVRTVEDINRAATNFRRIAAVRGMRIGICDNIASTKPMTDANGIELNPDIFGWSREGEPWWEDKQLALHSPMAKACRYESETFWANANGFYSRNPNRYLENIDTKQFFSGEFADYAVLMVPIHLPFGRISATSFNPLDLDMKDLSAIYSEYGELFGLLTRRFIAGYASAKNNPNQMPVDCALSKREVECLRWVALGKTDVETGIIASISKSTVRYHLMRAIEKLGAVNRAHSVFKAGQLGYLSVIRDAGAIDGGVNFRENL